jgi:transcriptional regulator with XRE-family HTH domain
MTLRKKFQLSQSNLAKKTGISQVMVGKYERGNAVPSIEVSKKIADAFEVSTDALIYGSNEQIINNKLNDEELLLLFHKVQKLDDQNITSVKAMLKAFVFQKDIQKQLA